MAVVSATQGIRLHLYGEFLLMGGAMFPPCFLTWGQNMVEVMKITATSFKRSCASTATFSAFDPAAGHCQPTPPPETPGHSWASLGQSLVGSLLPSPGSGCAQGFVCALQESVSPVLCKFWWLYGGVNCDSSKRAYAIPRSAAPRALAPVTGHCWPIPPQETLKHSKAGLTQSLWRLLVCTTVLFEPSEHLWWVWVLILHGISSLLPSFGGFSFALGHGASFLVWSNILLSMVVQQWVVIL